MKRAIIAAIVSGALLRAAFEVEWLLPVALVPAAWVAVRARGTRPGRAVVPLTYALYLEALLVPALPFGIADGQWGAQPFPLIVGGSPVLAVALLLVPLAGAVLYLLRFGSVPVVAPAWVAVVLPAAVWTALEVVRVKLDPGGMWGPLFASAPDALVREVAPVAGPFAVTFLVVAAAYAVASRALVALAAVAAAAAALALLDAPAERAAPVRVAAIQPGYDTAQDELPVLRHWNVDRRRASLDLVADLAPMTREAARRGADVVVWPEAVTWADVTPALRRVARRTGVTLVVPAFHPGPDHGATVILDPGGRVSHSQPKQRPMWFLGERGGNRVPPDPVRTAHATIGTLLGVDNQDPAVARRLAGAGATLLASSTHDWAQLAPYQRALTATHAQALRTPVVRADWRFGSAIFDASGRKVADAGATRQHRTVLVADVRPAAAATPYAGRPGVPAWLAVVVLVLGAAVTAPRRVRPGPAARSTTLPAP